MHASCIVQLSYASTCDALVRQTSGCMPLKKSGLECKCGIPVNVLTPVAFGRKHHAATVAAATAVAAADEAWRLVNTDITHWC
jgi:hypothetical protein